jgi:hypothetical protein
MQFETSTNITKKTFTVEFKTVSIKGIAILSVRDSFERIGGKMENTFTCWTFPAFVTRPLIDEIIHNTCFECGGLMKDGQAIRNGKLTVEKQQGAIEYPDPNNHSLIKVRKCTVCGHSHT